jgi:hypothetical protein
VAEKSLRLACEAGFLQPAEADAFSPKDFRAGLIDSGVSEHQRHVLRYLVSRSDERGVAIVSHKEIGRYVKCHVRTSKRRRKRIEGMDVDDRFAFVAPAAARGHTAGETLKNAWVLRTPPAAVARAQRRPARRISIAAPPTVTAPPATPAPPTTPTAPDKVSPQQRAGLMSSLQQLEEQGQLHGQRIASDGVVDLLLHHAKEMKVSVSRVTATVQAVMVKVVVPQLARTRVPMPPERVTSLILSWLPRQLDAASAAGPVGADVVRDHVRIEREIAKREAEEAERNKSWRPRRALLQPDWLRVVQHGPPEGRGPPHGEPEA